MANNQQNPNQTFLLSALERNWPMTQKTITQVGQVIDIELDQVPGWAYALDLNVFLDMAITVATGGAAPSRSPFSPENVFRSVELSLGGGPFQRVSPFFHYLRERAMTPGWDPHTAKTCSVPAIEAAAGSTEDNFWQFAIHIPLQVQYGSIYGHLPLGNASVKAKLRLTLQSSFWGTDQYLNPLYGGSGVSAAIGTAQQSYVQPNILYRTSPAASSTPLPTPTIGKILNVQENSTSFIGAGSLTPIKFSDPFQFLRLWHVVIDGTGAPAGTNEVNAFELDLTPGYPKFNYPNSVALDEYLYEMEKLYRGELPSGVYVFDLFSGSDPANPNGTQSIDATVFQTMQTQIGVAQDTNVSSPAKIITYAEALSPVAF